MQKAPPPDGDERHYQRDAEGRVALGMRRGGAGATGVHLAARAGHCVRADTAAGRIRCAAEARSGHAAWCPCEARGGTRRAAAGRCVRAPARACAPSEHSAALPADTRAGLRTRTRAARSTATFNRPDADRKGDARRRRANVVDA